MLHDSPDTNDKERLQLRKRGSDPLVAANHSALLSPTSLLDTSRKLSSPV